MRQLNLTKTFVKPGRHAGAWQLGRDRRKRAGLSALLLFCLLVLSVAPVSASNAHSRLLADKVPNNFNKLFPGRDSLDITTSPTLSWQPSHYADDYDYCIDSTLNSTCDGNNWINTLANTYANLTGLSPSTTYEWQVLANNEVGTTPASVGVWWLFTTESILPAVFIKSQPTNGLLIDSIAPTLSWGTSTNATSYEYCYGTTPASDCDEPSEWVSTAATSAGLSGLDYASTYQWQVRAINGEGSTEANGGLWWSFTTMLEPNVFTKNTPAINAINVSINPTLTWIAYPTTPKETDYEYCLDRVDTGSLNSCDSGWTTTFDTPSINIIGLANYTTYEWQIRAILSVGDPVYTNSGEWWTFTTVELPPLSFSKSNPTSGATNRDVNLTLSWGVASTADYYRYCYDNSLNNNCDASWTYSEDPSVLISDLFFNTQYEWQVRAYNSNPNPTPANGGTWWTFTTRAPILPGNFTKLSPMDTYPDQPTSLVLDWNSTTNATYYEYCLALAIESECTYWIDTGTTTQASISGLWLDTEYQWQVRASSNDGTTYANSNSVWTFKTVVVDPPAAFGKTSPANTSSNLLPALITLQWETATNADIYEYCIDDNPNGSCGSGWESNSDTNVDVTLDYGTTYEWQVRAFRNGNPNPALANGGSWWTFSSVAAQPGAFNKSEPINHATNQPTSLTLSWGISSGTGVQYQYCYEIYDGNSTCEGDLWSSPSSNNFANISGLNFATTYSWQVRAVNANPTKVYANNGSWYQFTTIIGAPADFDKLSPGIGTTQLLTLLLDWQDSPGATSYAYCYDSNLNGLCGGSWIATTATSAVISGLAYNTPYEWQVHATNLGGTVVANAGETPEWWTFTTVATPPGAFGKASPGKGLTGQDIALQLTWSASSGATGFEYCIDTTLDSVCDGNAWLTTDTLSSTAISGLDYLTTYQWQVRAKNSNPNPTNADSGTWWMFTTKVSPPAPFVKYGPGDGDTQQPSSQYLTWQPSNGATSYEYCLDLDPTPDETCGATWKPTNLVYANESSLEYGATYEWQVRAIGNGTTQANAGDWWTFTVKPLPAFSKANPNIGAINQPIDLQVTWTAAALIDTGYDYCIDDVSPTDDTCDSVAGWIAVDEDTTSVILNLENSTTYGWQVIAHTEAGDIDANAGETPEWWTFSTVEASPDAFSKSSPSNTAIAQKANDLTLSWADTPNESGYRYCLDKNLDAGHVGVCDTGWITVGADTTSVIVSNLENDKIYEWQVVASNENPVMTEANEIAAPVGWWTFTTAKAPPEAFDKLSPGDLALNQLLDLELSWEATVGAEYYQYCIDTSLNATCDGDAWVSTGTLTSVNPPGLVNATSYQWQVRAFSSNPHEPTLANGGSWFRLTTVVESPDPFDKNSPDSGLTDQPVDLMLSWQPSAGATGYEYCVDSDLVTPGCDGVWVETTSTQAIVTNLTNRTEYEWQVRAVNANPVVTESDSGDWFTFSTIPLHQYLTAVMSPQLTAPELKPVTVGPAVNTYTLSWNPVAGATTYKIWESLTTTFQIAPTYQTSSTSFTLPQARNPTRYYYYMTAESSVKGSPPSNILTVNRQYELDENDASSYANGPIFSGISYYGQTDDQKDYYKIYMDSPGTITVTMTSYPPTWPGQLQLFDGDITRLDYDINPTGGMQVTWTGTAAGWYYILIGTDASGYSSDWYQFSVTITH